MDTLYLVSHAGEITIHMHVKRNTEFPELPRFGLRLFLPEKMNQVTYCGLGPSESYPDKKRASYHGLFKSKVCALHEDYLRPQENGSHADCDYVTVSDGSAELTAAAENTISFNASPYTEEELTVKRHHFELEPSGCTVLHLDLKQNGIGSNSCGPRPKEKYRFTEEKFVYYLTMIPHVRTETDQ